MKKISAILIVLSIVILSVAGCSFGSSDDTTANSPESTVAETPTTVAEVTTEPDPTADYKIADIGYYNETTSTSIVPSPPYLNLFANRIYYTTPATKTVVPLEGEAKDWTVSDNPYYIVTLVEVQNGKFVFEAGATGYVHLKNEVLNKTATIYVNKPVEKINQNKQTYESLPYYLYLEKGSYTRFAKGTIALTVYRVDEEGYYTIPYLTICTACGAVSAKTPIGFHRIGGKDIGGFSMDGREYWHDWGGSYAQYAISYASGVYLHSTACGSKFANTVYTDNYNQVGTHASGGCLRMQAGSVRWIWDNCPNGTVLQIVDGNPRGTCIEPNLGEVVYGFDPTDMYLLTRESVK